jgi:monoamine oxidase
MNDMIIPAMTKRDLLTLIGKSAGATAMYMAMGALGDAKASDFKGPPKLEGDIKGASVLILGAGVAGMVAALELRRAGYKVQVLEFNNRVGGRSWTLKGGDSFTELGGATQTCQFAPGNYINPGPWRIPHHHYGLVHYCHELGVALEPFMQVNYNAYVHNTKAFGGKPQRYRTIQSDMYGYIAELLAKAVNKNALDDTVTKEQAEILLSAVRGWGGLDKDYRYVKGRASSGYRGWEKGPGGGLTAEPIPSDPLSLDDVLKSGLWRSISGNMAYDHQSAIFQPVGGMEQVAKGFERQVGDLVRLNSKVTAIHQDEKGVTAAFTDTKTGEKLTAKADFCLCTIPLPVLAQIEKNVSDKLDAAIAAVPYSPSVKVGLEFKRRFWEQDEQIYGGISYTDLPNAQISYPSTGYGSKGPGVLLGAYAPGAYAYEYTALSPAERVARTVEWGAQIHPQYKAEFMNGVAVAWHRVPWTLGCFGTWSDDTRKEHYQNLCAMDGRILLAGEHASYIGGWQEGAVTSSIDAITRLHQRVVAG